MRFHLMLAFDTVLTFVNAILRNGHTVLVLPVQDHHATKVCRAERRQTEEANDLRHECRTTSSTDFRGDSSQRTPEPCVRFRYSYIRRKRPVKEGSDYATKLFRQLVRLSKDKKGNQGLNNLSSWWTVRKLSPSEQGASRRDESSDGSTAISRLANCERLCKPPFQDQTPRRTGRQRMTRST